MKLRPIKSNMTELEISGITVLFSYETPVAYHQTGIGYFKTKKHWSATTAKHINQWLRLNGFSGNPDYLTEVDQEQLDNLVK